MNEMARPIGSEPPPSLAKGTYVGRFVVEERVASGGMGSLYRAIDPELDRVVALKLVRSASGDAAKDAAAAENLLLEAKVLAKLAHPHIVTVFEAGRYGDGVFIAMEFVEGATVREWSKTKRTVEETIELFVAAGEGLAAAHAADLVHRDFKPDNVLVGNDGRVRVVDFGLARASGELDSEAHWGAAAESPPTEDPLFPMPIELSANETQTRAGTLVGTPRYMAPEQILGLGVDARSDQFSFGVAFFEALYGKLPFSCDTWSELIRNVTAGSFSFPEQPRISRGLRAILVRALDPVPARRFPSMKELLVAIQGDRRRRRTLGLAAGAFAAIALSSGLGYGLQARAHPVCAAALDPIRGAWDDGARDRVKRAFLATSAPFAVDAWKGVERSLDSFAGAWSKMREDACEATQVRHVQSAELMDLRMQCLDHRLGDLRASIDVLASANAATVERGSEVVPRRGDLAICADAALLKAAVPPPADPATRARVDALRGELGHIRALVGAGRFAEVVPEAKRAAEDGQKVGDRPVEAEALLQLGIVERYAGDYPAAETALKLAARAGEAAHHDDVVARARIELVTVTDYEGHYPDADDRAEDAAAAVDRLGLDGYRADLAREVSTLLSDEGKFEAAGKRANDALAILEKRSGGEDMDVAEVLAQLGHVANEETHFDEAKADYQRALAILERALGADHPRIARAYMNLASVLRQTAHYDESTQLYERSIAILERAFGPDHDVLATVYVNLGNIELERGGDLAKALDNFGHAERIWEKKLGPAHPNVGTAELRIGMVLARQHDPAAALVRYGRARKIWEAALGADNANVGVVDSTIGSALLDEGKAEEAIVAQKRALAIEEKALGPTHLQLADPLLGLASALMAAGRPGEALAFAERGAKLRGSDEGDPIDLADAHLVVAQALFESGEDKVLARERATVARGEFERQGERGKEGLKRASALLARMPG